MDRKKNIYFPENAECTDWDVIVIGTGMGGATAGYELARQGKQVLFLEKGRYLFNREDRGDGTLPVKKDEPPEPRLQRGLWPYKIKGRTTFGQAEFYAPLGCGTGGSANLYAAQLERMLPLDFEPRKNHPNVTDSSLPEAWPVSYDDFLPYYRKAEKLFRVRGTQDPLNPDQESELIEPPALSARDADLFGKFESLGLHPYRAHVATEFEEGCNECGGVLCPTKCKNDPLSTCLEPALDTHGAKLITNCEVIKLAADDKQVTAVVCNVDDSEITFTGKVVVLAAGALHSPAILLKSSSEIWPNGLANSSDCVGRNLMWHVSDFIGVRPMKAISNKGPKKAISLNDFYVTDQAKLGTFQSVGVPINAQYIFSFLTSKFQKAPKWQRIIANPVLFKIVANVAAVVFRNTSIFATIVEDLPYHHNRIVLDPETKTEMRFEYNYPQELAQRSSLYRKLIKEKLKPRYSIFKVTGRNNLNFGHVCGTCRFGDDPTKSVLNRDNRCHDLSNLYITDSSFFPSSGGTNPSLTIAANAIRVAEVIGRG